MTALIPARAHSKRFLGKNLTIFLEIPLIAHSIKYALAQKEIDRVIVSTDCQEIKSISLEFGAEVIDRPVELATDLSPTIATMQHALEQLDGDIEYFVLLQPTNPLRPKGLFSEAIEEMKKNNQKSLFAVSPLKKKIGHIDHGKFTPLNYIPGMRSQDLRPSYYENGLLYITHRDLIKEGIIFDQNSYTMIVDHPYGQVDIDTPDDLCYAEFIFNTTKT
jgi:N-acylneuraminate cytidylyltransferase